jgi:putative two-component system hydrogenase maturation factor HypX/HoxX
VTVLQAEAEMDAGPVWASATFPMRFGKKSSLYRREVTEAAVRSVIAAVDRKKPVISNPNGSRGRPMPS